LAGSISEVLAGRYTLGRNEIEQVGFRLAKRLNLPTLYGIDFQTFMNGLTPSEMENSKPAKADSTESRGAEPTPTPAGRRTSTTLNSHAILATSECRIGN
jgi:hypothetical protein